MEEVSKASGRFQLWGTIMALFISSLALVVSIYETNLHRAEQKAMVWPFLTISSSFSGEGFSFNATNNGTGPALIKSVSLTYKGRSYKRFEQLLDTIKAGHHQDYGRIRMSGFNQTVMKAGEKRTLFFMPWDEESREMAYELFKASLKVQYCSVLEDCWIFESQKKERIEGVFKAEVEYEN
ncbi:MAG: hypothetical protein AAFY71_05350 [Bacteroidota bacterium]